MYTKPQLRFKSMQIHDPNCGDTKMMVFPKGATICVGTQNPRTMSQSLRRWLPRIMEARVVPALRKEQE